MIPFVDLKAQYQSIRFEVDAAIAGVLQDGALELVEQFLLHRHEH